MGRVVRLKVGAAVAYLEMVLCLGGLIILPLTNCAVLPKFGRSKLPGRATRRDPAWNRASNESCSPDEPLPRVPSMSATNSRNGAPKIVEPGHPEQSPRKLAILLIEHNRTTQNVIGKILRRAGHDVTIAENTQLAIEAIKASGFDVIVIDLGVPATSTIEAITFIRSRATDRARGAVVVLAADGTQALRTQCDAAGVDGLLRKPVDPARMLELLAFVTKAGANDRSKAATSLTAELSKIPDPSRAPALDPRTLEALQQLGGNDFVIELTDQFIEDASSVLKALWAIVSANDAPAFREQAHALRSAAANVGARRIYELCLAWRDIDQAGLAMAGERHLDRLSAEFDRVRVEVAEIKAARQVG
jgi:two-component system, sensor histidine kinase RpfC